MYHLVLLHTHFVCVCVCVSSQGSVIVESVLSSAVSGADLVVEAVVDDLDIKISIFQGIDFQM